MSAEPTDKDRDRAEQIVVTAMRSEIFRDALAHDTTRALEVVAAQGQADERARIVAALRKLETDIERESADHNGDMEGQIYERLIMAGADAVRKAADALERGEL